MAGGTRTDPVLITGCSSGIGRAAAVSLHHAGLRVYATARRVDMLADLASRGIATMALDVTDEASMTPPVRAARLTRPAAADQARHDPAARSSAVQSSRLLGDEPAATGPAQGRAAGRRVWG